jgi:hypothetical protein
MRSSKLRKRGLQGFLVRCNLTWAYLSGQEYEQLVKDKYAEYESLSPADNGAI